MTKKGKRAKDKRKTSTAQFVQASQLCSVEEMEGLHVLMERRSEAQVLDAERLPGILETLEEREQDALRFVLEAGGVMPLMEFVDRYGDDAGESPFWNWHVPNTTLGRLKIRGLLFEGTYEGQVVQVAPEELRYPCQSLARQWERTISNE